MIVREAVFERKVPAFDKAGFGQALFHRGNHSARIIGRSTSNKPPHHRQRRLLRPSRQRPSRRPTEPRDELPSPHSITSSAMASRFGGTARPSVIAVL